MFRQVLVGFLVATFATCTLAQTECKTTVQGTEYMGTVSNTKSGLNCQRWSWKFPHVHTFFTASKFPDDSLSDAANYCRNPDNEPDGPWCYTTNPFIRWQYCDVPMCDENGGSDGDDSNRERGVRFRDGASPNEGRLEVYINGHWGTVCHKNIRKPAWPTLACQQMGYTQAVEGYMCKRMNACVEDRSFPVASRGMQCGPEAQRVQDCTHTNIQCNHDNDVYLICE